jgi:hypothetical protein
MPIHDWTRIDAGLFHAFHHDWVTILSRALNAGVLPGDYFALREQSNRGPVPDVLTLKLSQGREESHGTGRGVAVAAVPPATRLVRRAEEQIYVRKADRIAVRHRHGDVVAVVEIVSPGNKASTRALSAFLELERRLARAHSDLGQAILELAGHERVFSALLEARPDDNHLWIGRGRYHALLGHAWDMGRPLNQFLLAMIHRLIGHAARAEALFRESIRLYEEMESARVDGAVPAVFAADWLTIQAMVQAAVARVKAGEPCLSSCLAPSQRRCDRPSPEAPGTVPRLGISSAPKRNLAR